jgi:hypothetical protein
VQLIYSSQKMLVRIGVGGGQNPMNEMEKMSKRKSQQIDNAASTKNIVKKILHPTIPHFPFRSSNKFTSRDSTVPKAK